MSKTCTSCKKSVANDSRSASFTCPSCLQATITRCSNCRKTAVAYKCQCNFEGP